MADQEISATAPTPQASEASKVQARSKTPEIVPRHTWVFPFMSFVYKTYLRLGGGWRVVGLENVPRTGGVILAPNHVSLLDPPLVGVTAGRRPFIMAKAELFHGIMGWGVQRMGSFPVKRGGADRAALKRARQLLASGEALLVFPEGTRSPDGKLGPPEPGVAMLAHGAKAPIVPVYIAGTEVAFSKSRPGFHWASPEIRYGKILRFEAEYARKADRETLDAITRRIMEAIAELGQVDPPGPASPPGNGPS